MSDLRLKCTKFDFRWRSASWTPLGELTALLQTPNLYLSQPTSKGRGKARGIEGGGKEREGRGGLAPNWGVWIRQWMPSYFAG